MIFPLLFPSGKIPTVTAQEKGVATIGGRVHFYDTPALRKAKAEIFAAIHNNVKVVKHTGPLKLDMTFIFHRNNAKKKLTWKTTKPDTDNLIKLFKDCFTKVGFWNDDAQVCHEVIRKYVTGNEQDEVVMVEIQKLADEEE